MLGNAFEVGHSWNNHPPIPINHLRPYSRHKDLDMKTWLDYFLVYSDTFLQGILFLVQFIKPTLLSMGFTIFVKPAFCFKISFFEKSIAKPAFDSSCCAAKVFTQVKVLGQWALPDSGCTWLRTGKERRPHREAHPWGRVSALPIPPNPSILVSHTWKTKWKTKRNVQVGNFIYLGTK